MKCQRCGLRLPGNWMKCLCGALTRGSTLTVDARRTDPLRTVLFGLFVGWGAFALALFFLARAGMR